MANTLLRATLLVSGLLAAAAQTPPVVLASVASAAAAPSPATATETYAVDGVFVTPASKAYMNATTLLLQGLPKTSSYLYFDIPVQAGIITQEAITGPSMNPNGTFLDGYGQAALYGTLNGAPAVAVLLVGSPQLSKDGGLSFSYELGANSTLLLAGGAANQALNMAAKSNSKGPALLTAQQAAGAMLSDVTLFTDASSILNYLPSK